MNQQIIHLWRDGLNNQMITLCGAEGVVIPHDPGCGRPCNCMVLVDCEDCAKELKIRAQRRAEAAKAAIAAKEKKMEMFGNPEIFD